MLLTVLLGITIFGLLLTALLMMVTMETRRSVSQKDTNAAFYAAEGAMNDTYIQLDTGGYASGAWASWVVSDDPYSQQTPGDLPTNEIVRHLEIDSDGGGSFVKIEIEAKAGKAKRKVAGIYRPPGTMAAGPSPSPTLVPVAMEYVGSSALVTASDPQPTPPSTWHPAWHKFTVPAGSGYIIKRGGNAVVHSPSGSPTDVYLQRRAYSYCDGPTATCLGKNTSQCNIAPLCSWKAAGSSAFLNHRLWRCVNSACPDFQMHAGDRVVYGLDPSDDTVIKSYIIRAADASGTGEYIPEGIISADASGVVSYRADFRNGAGYTNEVKQLKLFPKAYKLVLSPPGILDDDGGFGDRYTYMVLTTHNAGVTSDLFTNSPFGGVRTRVKNMVKQVQCASDGSPEDGNPQQYITPACDIEVGDEVGSAGGALLEVIYEDSVLTLLGGSIGVTDEAGNTSFYYFEAEPGL